MFFLNVGLLFFGLVSILAAFGGDTLGQSTFAFDDDRWSPDKVAFLKRITARGWTSLCCLMIALGLGVAKDKIHQQTVLEESTSRENLEADNSRLHERVADHVKEIITLREKISTTTRNLEEVSDDLKKKQLVSFNAAFKQAFKPPRKIDDAVVLLDGREIIPIPSRFRDQMQLYWEDEVKIITVLKEPLEEGLDSLKLKAGSKTYTLIDNPSPGSSKKIFLIDGNSPRPMEASILNPLRLRNLTLKIFVRAAELSKGQDRFKRMILKGRFPRLGKKLYKMTTPDILNVRSDPATTSPIRARLSSGSFVHSIRTQSGWTEVRTPRGKQGWVLTRLLSEIDEKPPETE